MKTIETKEYRTVDKQAWPDRGPWDGEPDKVQYTDEATGFPCLIVRNYSGALCGYVGVPEGHRLFGVPYADADIDVHGGLTFSDFCQPHDDESKGICHVPAPGDSDRIYWFGFDCAHSQDSVPLYNLEPLKGHGRYRTIEYVRGEIRRLAEQLKATPNESETQS